MIGIHQPHATGYDPVSVEVGIVAKRQVVFFFHTDQPCHRIGRRTIHANLAIAVDTHETEGRIGMIVQQIDVQSVSVSNRLPIGKSCPAKSVGA